MTDHRKQDFDKTNKFMFRKHQGDDWVKCINCLRWRRLPDGIKCHLIPENWSCHLNPDPLFRSCTIEEEDMQPGTNKERMKRTVATTAEPETKRQRVNGFHQNPSVTSTSPVLITPVVEYNDDTTGDDDTTDDDDVVILETISTPIPKKLTFGHTRVKSEQKTPTGTGPVQTNCIATSSMEAGTTATDSSPPAPPSVQVSITTQTETRNQVKDEEEEERKKENKRGRNGDNPSAGPSSSGPSTPGPSTPGPSTPGPSTPGPSRPAPSTPGPSTPGPSTPGPSTPGPSTSGPSTAGLSDRFMSDFHNLSQAQEQQNELMEFLQTTAYERDLSQEEVHQLTCQVHDLEVRVQELSQAAVKKNICHQACQTEEMDEG